VYKVGRSSQGIKYDGTCKRLQQYPKGSQQVLTLSVNNGVEAEREVIQKLVECPYVKQRLDLGRL